MIGVEEINTFKVCLKQECSMDLVFMFLWIFPYILLVRLTTKDTLGFLTLVLLGLITWALCLSEFLKVS